MNPCTISDAKVAGEATASPAKSAATYRHALVLLLGSCLPIMAAVLIAPVLPQIMRQFAGVAHADVLVPLALTVPALVVGLASPFAGSIVDRTGRKRLLLAGLVLYSACGTAPLYVESLAAVIASRVGVGIAEAVIMTVCTSLIADYFSGALRERYLAQQTIWASISATLFFGVGGALGEMGWRAPFWLYFAGLLLLPVMALMLWEPQADDAAHGQGGSGHPDGAGRPFPARAVAGICAITFGGAIAFYTLPVHLGFLMNGIGIVSPASIGMAAALGSVANVAGAVSFRRLSARGVPASLAIAFAALGAGFLVAASADGYNAMLLGAVLHGYGSGLLVPTMLTWLMRQLQFEERGRGTGMFMASFFSGQFVCPLIVLAGGKALGTMGAAMGALGWLVVVAAATAAAAATGRVVAARQA
ncbi:MFS transporter [Duganella sp. FT92W]|uniref:MFS transporter n=1 Tax=Pseudoduganella rivuli TaxID=2666085 RepID=A0A7X2IPP6_9BURK|nr:MFS transporter [Pseudoduganella rivuli]MRV73765.1 MFS transporter [Pseudoduganella rivuli]